jgi:prepilin-type N-terminal cleavage/methylation domain-containing protein
MDNEMIHLNTKTKGFTLVELIVAMLIAGICIVAAGSFLISGTNLLGKISTTASDKQLSEDAAFFVKERLLYAQDIQVIEGTIPPVVEPGTAILYVGNETGAAIENKGYVFYQSGGGVSPANILGTKAYGKNKISLDYAVTVNATVAKHFDITAHTWKDDVEKAKLTQSFKLVNSDMRSEPKISGSVVGVSKKYYILITGTFEPGEGIFADGDDPDNRDAIEYVVPATGRYKLEVWGADGGNGRLNGSNETLANFGGGVGGYAAGTIRLTKGTVVYLTAGGAGRNYRTYASYSTVPADSFNGGGSTIKTDGTALGSYNEFAGEGGGASDIRIATTSPYVNSLYARVIVAGGGGGGGIMYMSGYAGGNGGNGGGTTGAAGINNGNTPVGGGGTQSSGGSNGGGYTTASGFGIGGSAGGTAARNSGAAGGGGWYGGGASNNANSVHSSGGGGGSGWVFTYATYNAWSNATDKNQYLLKGLDEYYLVETVNVQVTAPEFVPKPTAGKGGYARITPIGR